MIPWEVTSTWQTGRVIALVEEASEHGVRDGADHLLDLANEHVPLLYGGLRESGEVGTDDTTSIVSYDTPYAIHLHEHPEYNFRGQGMGKWFEYAVKNADAYIYERYFAPPLVKVFRLP